MLCGLDHAAFSARLGVEGTVLTDKFWDPKYGECICKLPSLFFVCFKMEHKGRHFRLEINYDL